MFVGCQNVVLFSVQNSYTAKCYGVFPEWWEYYEAPNLLKDAYS